MPNASRTANRHQLRRGCGSNRVPCAHSPDPALLGRRSGAAWRRARRHSRQEELLKTRSAGPVNGCLRRRYDARAPSSDRAITLAGQHVHEGLSLDLILVTALMGLLALLYATVGQAGGTAYIAAMALFGFPHDVMRSTSLLLNVIAAGYATWRLNRAGAIDWRLLRPITAASLPMAFVGGLLVLQPQSFRIVVGVVL